MSYDPKKIEDWVVGLSGFWRKGEVNTDQYIVPFTGTWEQVNKRYKDLLALVAKHTEEVNALAIRNRQEYQTLLNAPNTEI